MPIERGENVLFGERVERRGGLVEQNDRRVLQDGARERHALLLAAAQLQAAFAHLRLVALRHALHRRVQVGHLRGFDDVAQWSPQVAVVQVVLQRVVEEHCVLQSSAASRVIRESAVKHVAVQNGEEVHSLTHTHTHVPFHSTPFHSHSHFHTRTRRDNNLH